MAVLTVATCQFPVGPDIAGNLESVRELVRAAHADGARLVHLPEAALTGYAGTDLPDHAGLEQSTVAAAVARVGELAAELGVWVALGTAYPVPGRRPFNSVLLLDPHGATVDRYDKRFCSGDPAGTVGDLAHYSPGDHPTVVEIDGVRCGVLICYDVRFPELYREYLGLGVDLVLHSFHTGNVSPDRVATIRASIGEEHAELNPSMTYPGITMPASVVAAAAANHVWISAATSSAEYSAFGAFAVRADGVTVGRLPQHRAGALITAVDTDADLYDSTRHWRGRAMAGVLHNGPLPESGGHCCPEMTRQVGLTGARHDGSDAVVRYDRALREYRLIAPAGGRALVGIVHCPWCGRRLRTVPSDRRLRE